MYLRDGRSDFSIRRSTCSTHSQRTNWRRSICPERNWRHSAGKLAAGEPALNARREASVRAQRFTQRGDQVPLDDVEEDAGDGVLPVEELLERVARQDEEERPLTRDRGDRRWATVDEALVAERLPRPRQSDADTPVAANQHLLDCAVDREVAGRRRLAFAEQRTPRRAP